MSNYSKEFEVFNKLIEDEIERRMEFHNLNYLKNYLNETLEHIAIVENEYIKEIALLKKSSIEAKKYLKTRPENRTFKHTLVNLDSIKDLKKKEEEIKEIRIFKDKFNFWIDIKRINMRINDINKENEKE